MQFVFKLIYTVYRILVFHLLVCLVLTWWNNSKISLGTREGNNYKENSEKKNKKELEIKFIVNI